MKKTVLFILALGNILPLFSQQEFTIDIRRPKKTLGAFSGISVIYMGEQKGFVKNNSGFMLSGVVPSDSIIELGFRLAASRPQKYFLYPNGSFNYNLEVRPGLLGELRIIDYSTYYGVAPSEISKRKATGLLPKGLTVNKRNLGVSYIYEKELKSEEIRKQWMRQGGKITGKSLSYQFTYGSMTLKTNDLKTTTTIVGGGWTYTQNYYNLKIPEFKPGLASWKSLIYGFGISTNLHISQVKLDPPPMDDMDDFGSASLFMSLTGNAGYTFGLGKFKTETNYKGWALDVTYKPSLILMAGPDFSDTQFNYMGFGFDLSRTSFSAFASRVAPKAKSKFSFLFLPPLKDTPLLITAGYGLVWYR